jgi:hypothetical protein
MENRMLTVKIKDIEMTIEEARELYNQLVDLFGPKLASLPHTHKHPLGEYHFVDPRYSITAPIGKLE